MCVERIVVRCGDELFPDCTMSTPDDSGDRAEWIDVGTFATGLEADIARDTLERAEIPVFVQSNAAGIFGLAFQGAVSGGITLRVPSPEAERALALLSNAPLLNEEEYADDETISP